MLFNRASMLLGGMAASLLTLVGVSGPPRPTVQYELVPRKLEGEVKRSMQFLTKTDQHGNTRLQAHNPRRQLKKQLMQEQGINGKRASKLARLQFPR